MEDQNRLSLVDEIERICNTSFGLLGKVYVPEENFFVAIQLLRSTIPTVGLQQGVSEKLFASINEMELIIEKGSSLLPGKRGVKKEDLLTSIQKVRSEFLNVMNM
jgi:hypothetical protein